MVGQEVALRNEEARSLATSAKRKLQRIEGALELLRTPPTADDFSSHLLNEDKAVSDAHAELMRQLEQTDDGDALKQARTAWWEAAGVAEFVRGHSLLHQYQLAAEKEVAEARKRWEATLTEREKLAECKRALARSQGRLYAVIELGLLDAASDGSVSLSREAVLEQLTMWTAEERATREMLEAQQPALAERRAHLERYHCEQGWRKGGTRFGSLAGLSADELLSARMLVLETDARTLRESSHAALKVHSECKAAHERTQDTLGAADGQIAFLVQLRESQVWRGTETRGWRAPRCAFARAAMRRRARRDAPSHAPRCAVARAAMRPRTPSIPLPRLWTDTSAAALAPMAMAGVHCGAAAGGGV